MDAFKIDHPYSRELEVQINFGSLNLNKTAVPLND